MSEEKLHFETDATKLLHLVVHSLYSEKQIFLRELISNASDACDRLRYQALTEPALTADDTEFKITITIHKSARTLEVADNGIGMSRDDLVRELGTIARSGTSAFLDQLTGDAKKDVALIGQFGVGFYSTFMIADQVEVTSRKAGEDKAWRWQSDGKEDYSVSDAERLVRGTSVTLHLRPDEDEFLKPERLGTIVKTYSDHIALPIILVQDGNEETMNSASALWTAPRNEISEDQYKEFYHHTGHAFDEPWATIHYKAEGTMEYTALVFIPSTRPFDLFTPERAHRVKLYVKRVFITDQCEALVPPYLRFLRGLVDSEDLPLNVSREMLQSSPLVARIRSAIVKRVFDDLEKKAEELPEEYETFWENFGAVLKEGIYEDAAQSDTILKLARFRSTAGEPLASLDDYVGRMKEGQQAIYYITGDEPDALRKSPQLEGFASRGIEVLMLTDPVDEFWVPAVGVFAEKPFKSVTRADADLSGFAVSDETAEDAESADGSAATDTLIAMFRLALKDEVKDVRLSDRLTDSPVCLIADEGDIDMHLERLLKSHGQLDNGAKRILEINPKHALIARLMEVSGSDGAVDRIDDLAHLLLDQARIVEGERLADPAAFSRRLADFMVRGLGG